LWDNGPADRYADQHASADRYEYQDGYPDKNAAPICNSPTDQNT
jgi:hypothetical protein